MLDFIFGLIGTLLYPLFSIFFMLLDLLQGVFKGLAGIGSISFTKNNIGNTGNVPITAPNGGDGGETSTGLIYYLLTSDLAKNLFMSILLLALFLIIVFTAMAFIKNAYSAKQKNWQEIVGNAFKGLANFIFLPVCCLLGVWLSNILLVAINGATSSGGATQMSRKLFVCCAYNANEYRAEGLKEGDIDRIIALVESNPIVDENGNAIGFVKYDKNKTDTEYWADIVDQVYAQTNVGIYAQWQVSDHYQVWTINYLMLIVGAVFMLYVLINISYAMIKRMFILLMLFVVSPAICAMYPLDEGSAVGNWKKEFIKYTISAYGAIAAMNIFFSILPIVDKISIMGPNLAGGIFDDIFQLLIMASGLFVVKEFMGTLSGWIGGDNAMSTGESLKKSATGAVKKYASGAAKTSGAFVATGAKIKSAFKEGGNKEGWKTVGRLTVGKGLDAIDKSVFGGEAGKLFAGIGFKKYDEEGKLIRTLSQQSAKAEKERLSTIKTSADTEKLRNEFLKGEKIVEENGKKQKVKTESGLEKFREWWKAAGDDQKAKNDAVARIFEEGEDSGVSESDILAMIMKETKLDVQDVRKMKREGTRQRNRLQYHGSDGEESSKVDQNKDGSTVTGGRSHVEDTMQERAENALLKTVNDHLAMLVSLQKESNDVEKRLAAAKENAKNSILSEGVLESRVKAQIDNGESVNIKNVSGAMHVDSISAMKDYNAAVKASADIQEVADMQMKSFIDNMKKVAGSNDLAHEAIKRFEKALDHSESAIQKLAKEIEVIIKGSKQ